MAVALVVLPFTGSLAALFSVVFVAGLTAGGVDVGGNVLLVWRVRVGLAPFMNFLHFAFGVGTFLAPVFLAQSMAWTGSIRVGYAVLAILTLPVAVLAVSRPSPQRHATSGVEEQPDRLLVGLTVAFLILYVAAEVGFGNWIYTFALEQGVADEVSAGYLTSAYWGAYTLGRLGSVGISMRVRPMVLLAACLALALASVAGLLLVPIGVLGTWICTILLGVALAPMFPVMVTFTGERTPITGGVTSLFLVGASAGAMSLPWLIGQLFGRFGPRVMPALVLVDVAVLASVFAVVAVLFARKRPARRSP